MFQFTVFIRTHYKRFFFLFCVSVFFLFIGIFFLFMFDGLSFNPLFVKCKFPYQSLVHFELVYWVISALIILFCVTKRFYLFKQLRVIWFPQPFTQESIRETLSHLTTFEYPSVNRLTDGCMIVRSTVCFLDGCMYVRIFINTLHVLAIEEDFQFEGRTLLKDEYIIVSMSFIIMSPVLVLQVIISWLT